ncbi:uncharacterized protein AMSG_11424 [Thecamonas trahens ATCC 50062]|uniref:Uncharacterized protein n=1 Tax=Thecamonas trahens ATCC 50062 TaxID=461836 RepID=A0A0L0DWN5_THETB|nr:hypothetical protein AMSG_11424 [Thecamonas trahens ATCC 50062]KNC55948.1 hypothetical protein AMSG_11424 [Thecamonas trahens ATCC 50062]|eukprot:XP_013752689.1 hypothetical protein AMSG_11424 [Thecamonas trahens ATCC 50062]
MRLKLARLALLLLLAVALAPTTTAASLVVPALHSRAGAGKVFYLNFVGASIPSGTPWNSGAAFTVAAFSHDGDRTAISSDELLQIKTIHAAVAEDFAPFDVDVTTEESTFTSAPLANRATVIFTNSNDVVAGDEGPMQAAFGLFGSTSGKYEHGFVFDTNVVTVRARAVAASRALGRMMGLYNDGKDVTALHPGDAVPGAAANVGWGPIMGAPYTVEVTQWSKGDYSGATSTQDDLAVIASKIPVVADEAGDTLASATAMTIVYDDGSCSSPSATGVITTDADVDVYAISIGWRGSFTLTVSTALDTTYASYSNLNIKACLYQVDGTNDVLITCSLPEATTSATELGAAFSVVDPAAHDYKLTIEGIGDRAGTTGGYSGYGSLGSYKVPKAEAAGAVNIVTETFVRELRLVPDSRLIIGEDMALHITERMLIVDEEESKRKAIIELVIGFNLRTRTPLIFTGCPDSLDQLALVLHPQQGSGQDLFAVGEDYAITSHSCIIPPRTPSVRVTYNGIGTRAAAPVASIVCNTTACVATGRAADSPTDDTLELTLIIAGSAVGALIVIGIVVCACWRGCRSKDHTVKPKSDPARDTNPPDYASAVSTYSKARSSSMSSSSVSASSSSSSSHSGEPTEVMRYGSGASPYV